jgi:predicted TIM-barrel fold metal-dependent hydrolase
MAQGTFENVLNVATPTETTMTDNQYQIPGTIIDGHNHLGEHDPTGSKLLELMDAHNVERTLIMGTPMRGNDNTVTATQANPDRFVGGACLDPRDGKKAVDAVKHYADEGMRIIKLFPNFGYYPDDDAFGPFFDAIAEQKMGVLSHCGWLAPRAGVTAAYYSHPGRFEKVIRRLPELPFIMAHMGGIAGFLESVMLATRTPNTYIDCSPGQGYNVLNFAPAIAGAIPPEKLLWGLDCYDYDPWKYRYADALAGAGFGPHFDKVWYSTARTFFEKIGAIPAEA